MRRAFSPHVCGLLLGLHTPTGKSARRGPRFGLGWYGAGLRPWTEISPLFPKLTVRPESTWQSARGILAPYSLGLGGLGAGGKVG